MREMTRAEQTPSMRPQSTPRAQPGVSADQSTRGDAPAPRVAAAVPAERTASSSGRPAAPRRIDCGE